MPCTCDGCQRAPLPRTFESFSLGIVLSEIGRRLSTSDSLDIEGPMRHNCVHDYR